jgi:hypothetical protein
METNPDHPANAKEGSLLPEPQRAFDSQDNVEREVVHVPLKAVLEWNCAGGPLS